MVLGVKNWLAAVLWILGTAGCASSTTLLQPGEEARVDLSIHGLLIGSVGHNGNYPVGERRPIGADEYFRHGYYNLMICQERKCLANLGKAIPSVFLQDSYKDQKGDYVLPAGFSYLYVLPIAEGEYTLDFIGYGNGVFNYYTPAPLGIPITVEAGKVVCLGEVIFQHAFAKALFGNMAPTFAEIQTTDQCERDLSLAVSRFKSLKGLEYSVEILEF